MELYDGPELIPFRKEMRKKGVSKNNFFSLYDLGITGLVKLSVLPLRIIVFVGFILSLIFFILGSYYLLYKIFYWDSFDPELMAETLERGLASFEEDRQAASRALQEYTRQFSWENCIHAYLQLYRSILS